MSNINVSDTSFQEVEFHECKIIGVDFSSCRDIIFDIKEGYYFKLASSEFLFLVSTLILGVSLISVLRPFPIGWDDLGTYMNHPHLLATAKSIISL